MSQISSGGSASQSAKSTSRDESLEDLDNRPAPEVIAREIVEDLEATLAEFSAVALGVRACHCQPDVARSVLSAP